MSNRKGENNPMFGRHHSEESKNKTSLALKGRPKLDTTKTKIGLALKLAWMNKIPECLCGCGQRVSRPRNKFVRYHQSKGIYNVMFGKYRTEEDKQSISNGKKGKKPKLSQEERKNRAERGRRQGFINKGKILNLTTEQRLNRSLSKIGELNGNWKGGIGNLPYSLEFNKNLKERIKSRDGYICQLCGYSNPNKLRVHHIDYNKLNTNEDNFITLCCSCNTKVNKNRDYWVTYFNGIVRKNA